MSDVPAVSLTDYGGFQELVFREVKQQGVYPTYLIKLFLPAVITEIERAVACQYCYQTKSYDVTAGEKNYELEGLILGQDHPWQVSVLATDWEAPVALSRIEEKNYPPGMADSYEEDDWSIPGGYWPLGVDDRPAIQLLPPPDSRVTKVFVRGYWHSTLPAEWENSTTHWLIRRWPMLLLHGVAAKMYLHYKQMDLVEQAMAQYRTYLLGDEDLGFGGLAAQQKSARAEDPKNMRIQLSPHVATLRELRPAFDPYLDRVYPGWYAEY